MSVVSEHEITGKYILLQPIYSQNVEELPNLLTDMMTNFSSK